MVGSTVSHQRILEKLGGGADFGDDHQLRPILLGRGVEAPMPVVLLGAIGGLIASGVVGLFVGAVIFTLGYKLFLVWLGDNSFPNGSDSQ